MEIRTEILIQATPEKIWAILTDFEKYPGWNPFIRYIKGTAKVGHQIEVRIEPPGAKGMLFKPKILGYEANTELRWLGHFLIPGLMDGEHAFTIIDHQDATSTFIQSENFKGILVPLFKKQLSINTKNGFELMNTTLKELAERN